MKGKLKKFWQFVKESCIEYPQRALLLLELLYLGVYGYFVKQSKGLEDWYGIVWLFLALLGIGAVVKFYRIKSLDFGRVSEQVKGEKNSEIKRQLGPDLCKLLSYSMPCLLLLFGIFFEGLRDISWFSYIVFIFEIVIYYSAFSPILFFMIVGIPTLVLSQIGVGGEVLNWSFLSILLLTVGSNLYDKELLKRFLGYSPVPDGVASERKQYYLLGALFLYIALLISDHITHLYLYRIYVFQMNESLLWLWNVLVKITVIFLFLVPYYKYRERIIFLFLTTLFRNENEPQYGDYRNVEYKETDGWDISSEEYLRVGRDRISLNIESISEVNPAEFSSISPEMIKYGDNLFVKNDCEDCYLSNESFISDDERLLRNGCYSYAEDNNPEYLGIPVAQHIKIDNANNAKLLKRGSKDLETSKVQRFLTDVLEYNGKWYVRVGSSKFSNLVNKQKKDKGAIKGTSGIIFLLALPLLIAGVPIINYCTEQILSGSYFIATESEDKMQVLDLNDELMIKESKIVYEGKFNTIDYEAMTFEKGRYKLAINNFLMDEVKIEDTMTDTSKDFVRKKSSVYEKIIKEYLQGDYVRYLDNKKTLDLNDEFSIREKSTKQKAYFVEIADKKYSLDLKKLEFDKDSAHFKIIKLGKDEIEIENTKTRKKEKFIRKDSPKYKELEAQHNNDKSKEGQDNDTASPNDNNEEKTNGENSSVSAELEE